MKLLIFVLAALTVMFLVGARTGTIEIPGLTPAKKKTAAANVYAADSEAKPLDQSKLSETMDLKDDAPKSVEKSASAPAAPDKDSRPVENAKDEKPSESSVAAAAPAPANTIPAASPPAVKPRVEQKLDVDPLAGQRKLATVWQKLDPAAVLQIVDKWKDDDLALQLSVMPEKQVGEILSQMKPARASTVSLRLQKIAQDQAKKEAEDKAKSGT